MKLLLDTHAFLWYLLADPRLSAAAQAIMTDVRNELLLSIVSAWEIGIKTSIGKLALPGPFDAVVPPRLQQAGIRLLPIKLEDVGVVASLPFHHKDPFDRMLVAQCLGERIPILSADVIFDQYAIQRLW